MLKLRSFDSRLNFNMIVQNKGICKDKLNSLKLKAI